MRIKFMQDIIDKIRGKKKIIPIDWSDKEKY